jgi:D-arabinose 1-dehydrogenase-like Zn-dependent alcohol dehydrogenase
LPIPTTRDGETLSGTAETFESVCESLPFSSLVVGYEIPKKFREMLSSKNIIQIDVSRDEEYLSDNAELTAVGTVGRILCEEKCAPADLKIGIIGCGRIGKRLVRALMFLGADVTVFTSNSELYFEMGALGVDVISSGSLSDEETLFRISRMDILINTAPVKLVADEARERLASLRIIELAGGNNFPDGLCPERFMSVPALMYPKSAGIALGKSVLRMLGEETNSFSKEGGGI